MNPLRDWHKLRRGYTFGVETFYNDFHIGLDIIAHLGTPIYAPCRGRVEFTEGKAGGKTALLYARNKVFRFLHMSAFGKKDFVSEGEIIGFIGNTGKSTGPHLHMDISRKSKLDLNDRNNFIDPEEYFAPKKMTVFFVANRVSWDYAGRLGEVSSLIEQYTRGDLQVEFIPFDIDIDPDRVLKTKSLSNGVQFVSNATFKPYIKFAKKNDIIMYYQDGHDGWPDIRHGGWSINTVMEQEFPVRGKFGIALWGFQNASRERGEKLDYFTGNVLHELSHTLHVMSGQEDLTHYFDYEEGSLSKAYENINIDMIRPSWDRFIEMNAWIHNLSNRASRYRNTVLSYKKQYYQYPNIIQVYNFLNKKYV